MNRILDRNSPEVSRLLLAMGGSGRIRSVQTMLRETRTWRRTGSGPLQPFDRVVTHRAAGGRIRIETHLDGTEPGMGAGRLLIVPPSRGERARAALRDARLEPRNLLAHLHERTSTIRTVEPHLEGDGAGGSCAASSLVIDLPEEQVTFTFDSVTGLCLRRRDLEAGFETAYFDWRLVNGIMTPFLEIDEPLQKRGASFERRLLAVAYDLPFPNELFDPIIGAS